MEQKVRLETKYGENTVRFYVHYIAAYFKNAVYEQFVSKGYIEGNDNHLFIIHNGQEKEVNFKKLGFLKARVLGNGNIIKIDTSSGKDIKLNIFISGDNNIIEFGYGVTGNWDIKVYEKNNFMSVGENTSCCSFSVALHGNQFLVGKNCMISAEEELWTDGHSVIDVNTHKVLNKPTAPIIIGNHVWLGRRVTLTKGAQIPDDCIVGIGSVVTKKFTEPHCVIAGNPAKVVKTGVSWDKARPIDYVKK